MTFLLLNTHEEPVNSTGRNFWPLWLFFFFFFFSGLAVRFFLFFFFFFFFHWFGLLVFSSGFLFFIYFLFFLFFLLYISFSEFGYWKKKWKKAVSADRYGPTNSVKNWVMNDKWWVMSNGNWAIKKVKPNSPLATQILMLLGFCILQPKNFFFKLWESFH